MGGHRVEFTESENPWAPTAVVAEINARNGCGLELVGLAEQTGGVGSAAFVRWPDGREGAVTRTDTSLDQMRRTAEVLAGARSCGMPVPRHDLVLDLDDGKVTVVQERLPGRRLQRVDASVVDAVVAMNDRFADLLADRPDVPPPPAFPTPGHSDHPWEDTLGRYSDRTRQLLTRIREIDGGEPYQMVGDDLVHTDYTLENMLFDEQGHISGVVDWNFGAFRGDRRFALLSMRCHFEGEDYEGRQDAISRLDEILDSSLDPTLLRIYWAHSAIGHIHWSITKRFPSERINRELRFAERHLT